MERPGQVVTREEYDRGAPIGFRLGSDRYFRTILSRALPIAVFRAYFHARGDWAMYLPAGENSPGGENFSRI
jgi:hypothetical protein